MKQIWLISLCFLHVFMSCVSDDSKLSVHALRRAKMKLALVTIGDDHEAQESAKTIFNDFSFSGQFDVTLYNFKQQPSKKHFKDWYKQGCLVSVFLTAYADQQALDWRIYDTRTVSMLKGRRYRKRGDHVRGWGHNIADMIWPELMGHESSFSSKIAFCKDVVKDKKRYKHIYIADYDGSNAQPLVTTPTVNVAPRWNRDLYNPLLFYSESAQSNISMRIAAMDGTRRTASNFDGLNMLPTFSKDGKKIVYCISKGDGHCDLYLYEDCTIKRLTHNGGNNISPNFSDDGSLLYFCSDYKSRMPLIYCYNLSTHKCELITPTGPCLSPSLSEKRQKLVYSKRVDGIMQLFFYDLKTKKHTQFTTDTRYHKEDCSWSPCGNYLLFSVTAGNRSCVATEHIVTHERQFLTASTGYCSYPTWSPIYYMYPSLDQG